MAEIPTIKVKHGDDYMVINAEDFDPKQHQKYDADEAGGKKTDSKSKKADEAGGKK